MNDKISEAWDDFERQEDEAELASSIKKATTFEELTKTLDDIGRIKKTDGTVYSADELIEKIEWVRSGQTFPDVITRTGGLRAKVTELFAIERIANALDITSLDTAIDVIVAALGEPLKSSNGTEIPSADLKAAIRMVVEEGLVPELVTRQYGLRDKAIALRQARAGT